MKREQNKGLQAPIYVTSPFGETQDTQQIRYRRQHPEFVALYLICILFHITEMCGWTHIYIPCSDCDFVDSVASPIRGEGFWSPFIELEFSF